MKFFFSFFLLFSCLGTCFAQRYFDTLQHYLQMAKDDDSRIVALGELAHYYNNIRPDSSFFYAKQTIDLAQQSNNPYGEVLGFICMSYASVSASNYRKALEMALKALDIAKGLKKDRLANMAQAYRMVGVSNRLLKDTSSALSNFRLAIHAQEESGEPMNAISIAYTFIGNLSLDDHPDSALFYARRGYELGRLCSRRKPDICLATAILGNAYDKLEDYTIARQYYQIALQTCVAFDNFYIMARVCRDLARHFKKMGNPDSCLYYAQLSLQLCLQYNFGEYASDAAELLATLYESEHTPDSALKYFKVMLAAKDSIFSPTKMRQSQLLIFADEQKQREINREKERYRNQLKLYGLLAIIAVFISLTVALYRNNRLRKRSYELLKKQKQLTDAQKQKAEDALLELKATQAQLIQSEKMASLGELSAGIAHEIQNPLNFVNNFSEVNKELIEEVKSERIKDKSERNEELEIQLLDDIGKNLEKISHHGKRADAIVKGMLQHSRVSTGQKEPTDINALADEYLRLSYHGMKAKDKSFTATLQTDFDSSVGKIEVVPQEIGRVFLNLFNNAFYAVSEKAKQNIPGYEPTVTVSTTSIMPPLGGKRGAEIRVKDNGNGIPDKLKGKIFQPFFTTKPAGQGTGLGLSLSYDIVKAHGGEITMETGEGQGSEFIIELPLNNPS